MTTADDLLEKAAERYAYDESSPSCLVWKIDSGRGKTGKPAGSLASGDKYYSVQAVPGKSVRAHHVVWFLFHKKAPEVILDHINGDGTDNRISNLREADFSKNNWKRNHATTSKTGVKNVHLTKYGTYRVCVWKNDKGHHFGTFKTLEEATEVANKIRAEIHGEYTRQ